MSVERKEKWVAVQRLTGELVEMFAKSRHLESEILQRLGAIGYEF